MCLIVYKPAGVDLPPRDILHKGFENNKDGMGIAWVMPNDEAVHIRKGAMSWKKAKKLLNLVPDTKAAELVIHFRMATDGTVCPGNCHPFPVVASDELLATTELDVKYAIVHNGIITSATTASTYDKEPAWWHGKGVGYSQSDTQLFIKEYLAGMGTRIFNKQVAKLIGEFTHSKFAFLSPSKTMLVGEFHKHEGCFFSNYSYNYTYISYIDNDYRAYYQKYGDALIPPSLKTPDFVKLYGAQKCDWCSVSTWTAYRVKETEAVLCETCAKAWAGDGFTAEEREIVAQALAGRKMYANTP